MDIAALSPTVSQINLETQLGVALLENFKELAEVQAEGLQEMMASVPIPGLGEHIDVSL